MSKEGSLTDKERLFRLKQKQSVNTTRIMEIDTWLSIAGRNVKTKQDQRIKNKFLEERKDLCTANELLTRQIRELGDVEIRKRLKGEVQKPLPHRVTDHALVRWLERKHGIDVKEMREALYAEVLHALENGRAVAENGRGTRITTGHMVYVMEPKSKSIMTCYTLDEEDILNK